MISKIFLITRTIFSHGRSEKIRFLSEEYFFSQKYRCTIVSFWFGKKLQCKKICKTLVFRHCAKTNWVGQLVLTCFYSNRRVDRSFQLVTLPQCLKAPNKWYLQIFLQSFANCLWWNWYAGHQGTHSWSNGRWRCLLPSRRLQEGVTIYFELLSCQMNHVTQLTSN